MSPNPTKLLYRLCFNAEEAVRFARAILDNCNERGKLDLANKLLPLNVFSDLLATGYLRPLFFSEHGLSVMVNLQKLSQTRFELLEVNLKKGRTDERFEEIESDVHLVTNESLYSRLSTLRVAASDLCLSHQDTFEIPAQPESDFTDGSDDEGRYQLIGQLTLRKKEALSLLHFAFFHQGGIPQQVPYLQAMLQDVGVLTEDGEIDWECLNTIAFRICDNDPCFLYNRLRPIVSEYAHFPTEKIGITRLMMAINKFVQKPRKVWKRFKLKLTYQEAQLLSQLMIRRPVLDTEFSKALGNEQFEKALRELGYVRETGAANVINEKMFAQTFFEIVPNTTLLFQDRLERVKPFLSMRSTFDVLSDVMQAYMHSGQTASEQFEQKYSLTLSLDESKALRDCLKQGAISPEQVNHTLGNQLFEIMCDAGYLKVTRSGTEQTVEWNTQMLSQTEFKVFPPYPYRMFARFWEIPEIRFTKANWSDRLVSAIRGLRKFVLDESRTIPLKWCCQISSRDAEVIKNFADVQIVTTQEIKKKLSPELYALLLGTHIFKNGTPDGMEFAKTVFVVSESGLPTLTPLPEKECREVSYQWWYLILVNQIETSTPEGDEL